MSHGTRLLVFSLLLVAPTAANAREGLFLRFSLGPGVTMEASAIDGPGLALPAKDHAIGYGVTESFAVQFADFGALVHKQVGEFSYMNLDGLGLGGVLFLPRSTQVSLSAGYGQVTFARNWWEATGTNKDDGLAVSATLRKEWPFASRWALGVGALASFFRTFGEDYTFFDLSVVGSLSFYLTPVT